MTGHKRAPHSLPAGIVVLGATLLIVAAQTVSVAAASPVSAPKITAAVQLGQTVALVAPGTGSDPVYGPTAWAPAARPASAPQPGQTIAQLTAPSAPGVAAAPQPGQTVNSVAPGNGGDPVSGPTSWAPSSGTASAPQPGQTGW